MAAATLGLSFCEGIVAAFYPNWLSYRAESKSWKCLELLMIISWSILSSLTAYSISFTILGMSLLVSQWRQRHFQYGRQVADQVIAALSRDCSRGWSKRLSRGCRLFIGSSSGDCLAFLLGRAPILSWPRRLSKRSQVFHRRQLHLVTAQVWDEQIGQSYLLSGVAIAVALRFPWFF